MRMYAFDRAETGEYLDPLPLNRELKNLVGRMNGLDGWAFAADLAAAKWSTTAFGEFGRWVETVAQDVEVEAAAYNGFGDYTPAIQLMPIPNDSGTPWVENLDVSDGLLEVRLLCHVEIDSFSPNMCYKPGVFVDGLPLWGPTITGAALEDAWFVHGCVPVGAGSLTIQPMLHVWNSSTGAATLTFNTRTLAVRAAVR